MSERLSTPPAGTAFLLHVINQGEESSQNLKATAKRLAPVPLLALSPLSIAVLINPVCLSRAGRGQQPCQA